MLNIFKKYKASPVLEEAKIDTTNVCAADSNKEMRDYVKKEIQKLVVKFDKANRRFSSDINETLENHTERIISLEEDFDVVISSTLPLAPVKEKKAIKSKVKKNGN